MTSPARQQSPPSSFSPLAEGAPEPVREPSPEIRDALLKDEAELQREVILWQRWIRCLALLVITAAAIVLSARPQQLAILPLIAVAAGYVASVFIAGWAVRRAPTLAVGPWLPALLVTADLVTIGAIIFITSMPLVSQRFLILALLSVPLAAFYFGWGLGVYAAVLAAGIYLLIAEVLPPLIPGPRPVSSTVNVALFALVAGVLIYTFGRFRARLNKLRPFCKAVE